MSSPDDRPNILMVMCDQLSAFATSPYGNTEVLTPHLNQLAERGVTFENAYCNAPLCAPSRASMMTGRLPDSIPVNDNAEELPSSIPTFAHHLRRAGYKTVLSGKMHFVGPDQLHGFEERLTTDIYRSDLGSVEDWATLGSPPRQPLGRIRGRYMAHMIAEAGPVSWSTQMDYDEEVHFRALERIRQLSRRDAEEASPWFLCVSYTQPHDPYAPTHEYWDRYEGRQISAPKEIPEGYTETAWDAWVNGYHGVDIAQPSAEEALRARRAYYAMTSYIDDKLGELQRELERFAQLENTVVIFLSDHGDMMGEHGMFFKRTFREWSARVPLLFAGPKITQGDRVSAPVSLVDVFPTILALAKTDLEANPGGTALPGQDILSMRRFSRDDPAASPVIIDYNANGTIAPTRTIISGSYKYVHVLGQDELLFDLKRDPEEWENLAAREDSQPVLERLRAICMSGWDPIEVERHVLASQRNRAFVNEALSAGYYEPWDYQPQFDASRMYVRRPISEVWDHGYTNQFSASEGAG